VNWFVLNKMRHTALLHSHEASYQRPVEYLPEATDGCLNPDSPKIEEQFIQTSKLSKVIIVMYSSLDSRDMALDSEVGIKIMNRGAKHDRQSLLF
jgi:hypothetical protein